MFAPSFTCIDSAADGNTVAKLFHLVGSFAIKRADVCGQAKRKYKEEGDATAAFLVFYSFPPSSLALRDEIGLAFYVFALNYSERFNKKPPRVERGGGGK